MAHPPDRPDTIRNKSRHCVYAGPARAIPPAQRVKRKKYPRFDDPVVPRSYWYLTAALVAAALVLGVLVGVILLS